MVIVIACEHINQTLVTTLIKVPIYMYKIK